MTGPDREQCTPLLGRGLRWKRRLKGQQPCSVGALLSHDARDLDRQLKYEIAEDRKPAGMEPMF